MDFGNQGLSRSCSYMHGPSVDRTDGRSVVVRVLVVTVERVSIVYYLRSGRALA